ncbi:cell division protein ZapE [Truepera radiovictrix]|uniref:AFG1-family ATPase n=1 Tax=Truepera radiovictrix (strain DSM 17093 / CIP 108686 / LMG 22925 / RQ-24) TaxID=649638 RepID=D7CQA1_TRURR|nr:cell division protein ZapE [Truepera radiovictrix]ADI14885.1 AFG1-family ATPase [Truepera radiovictrix DSM 17093]WMT56564.1 cell division protein ZapE [Truepera radiovictrix]
MPLPPLSELVPPPRFGHTRFADYEPQHPSQTAALVQVQAFVDEIAEPQTGAFRWPWQRRAQPQGRGLYLDGGFGVGKTHLLAAAYHASKLSKKAYLSFQELVYVIGVRGTARAKAELGDLQLLCIDEFELDDPGNTLIVKTFLAHLFEQGGAVITTSNTPPEAQGQGRFNAGDFQREIQSVAERFEVLPIEGPDFRHRDHLAGLLSASELEHRFKTEGAPEPKERLAWPAFLELLGKHHPIRYRELLGAVGTLYLEDAQTLATQNDALRFVHFIDKLYDLKKGLRLSGTVALRDLFDPSYRESAYAKKHHRCLSRLSELLEERF